MQLKRFGKFVFALIAIWVVLIATGLLFSHSFQNKIISALSEQADKHLLAEVHIRKNDVHFSVLKKFPLASVELRNIVIKVPEGVNLSSVKTKHADTLLFAKKLYLQMNLRELLKNKYQLQKISVADGFIQMLKDKNGNSSLKIIKSANNNKSFHANIRSFSLTNMDIYSMSAESKFQSSLYVKKGEASGTFSKSNFAVNIKSNGLIKEVILQGERLQPMQKYKLDVAFDRKEQLYSIRKGYYQISNIPMKVIGTINAEKNTFIDLVFSAQEVSLKQVDKSFLNGLIGQTGFEPKAGKLSLQSAIKGYVSKSIPSISANFLVTNARIFNKQKETTYSDIYLKGNANNGHIQHLKKSLHLSIDTFSIKTDGSVQNGALRIKNLKTPEISASIHGVLDANDLKKYLSIPEINILQGQAINNINIKGKLPLKEKNIPGKLVLNGEFALENVQLQLKKHNIPDLNINGTVKVINNTTLKFDTLFCKAANSDLTINGVLVNFKSETKISEFKGSVASKNFYVTDFIVSDQESSKKMQAIVFPDSIKVNSNLTIENFYFGKFASKSIGGYVTYKNNILDIHSFTLKAFSGSVTGNVVVRQLPSLNISMDAKAFLRKNNMEEMLWGFNNFGQDIISSEHLNGNISGTIQYTSVWNNTLNINKESINAYGKLLIENGELKDYEPLLGLSKFINVEELKHIRFDNLSTNIRIQNRKVMLDQTNIASSAISFAGSGIHDFDNKYEYRLQVALSDLLWKKARRKKKDITEFGYIVDDNNRTTIPFLISGKNTTFDVKYDKQTSRSTFKQKVKKEKRELKKLLNNDTINKEEVEETNSEPEEENNAPVLKKTDSGTYRIKTDEAILDWDDS